jgi:hypothetical protein
VRPLLAFAVALVLLARAVERGIEAGIVAAVRLP